MEISPSIFGRNAAQIAKQVVIQRLQEAERDIILDEFKGRVGEILSGLREARVDGLVKTREDEVRMVKGWGYG